MCDIAFTGNNVTLDKASTVSVTVNGTTTSFTKPLDDLVGIKGNIEQALTNSGVTYIGVLASTISDLSEINLNSGGIQAYIQIFYPNTVLDASLEMTINGTPQTFTFNKIPTV